MLAFDNDTTEVDLRYEAHQLSLLIQSVTDYAIYMLDPQGYVRSWNSGGQRIKGYSQDEIIGQHFSRFYLPEEVEKRMPESGLEAARTRGKYEAEGWRLRKDGTRFRASVVIDPIWREGQWIDVPDDAVITVPNRFGRTMVWPIKGASGISIRCFLPGSMI